MKSPENELITHIKESLIGHEEKYEPGAWENFDQKSRKKKGLTFWILPLSSAAVLLIAMTLFFSINKKTGVVKRDEAVTIVKETIDTPHNPDIDPIVVQTIKKLPQAKNNKGFVIKNNATGAGTMDFLSTPSDKGVTGLKGTEEDALMAVKTDVKVDALKENKTPINDKKMTFQDFLNTETNLNKGAETAQNATAKENKWELGLVVAPSFGNTKKLNIGYGVSMGYAVSDRISLNSGISYNEMAASRDVASPATVSTAIAGSEKNLESVEARLVGIDIPLEVKYHLNKNIYANVGISAFAVLNQKQNNNYIQERVVAQSSPNAPVNTPQGSTAFVVNERTSEEVQPEAEIKDGRYLGFYNFSVGYKQKISKDKSVSIEPFIKVPMKEVTKENLRLLGTGVRLKIDF